MPDGEQEGSLKRNNGLWLTIAAQLLFLGVLSARLMFMGVFPTLEVLAVLLIVALVWRASHRRLLVALMPFLLLLLSYQILRGFADDMTRSDIHIVDLIVWEKALFGGIVPAAYLQAHIVGGTLQKLLDIVANTVYMSHFVTPVLLAVVLYYTRRDWYWRFVLGLVILSYAGFVTYLLFPAAPPWWATKYGYLVDQPVTLARFIMPAAPELAGPNPVAAMPSLHTAWPTYFVCIAVAVWGNRGWLMALLLITVAFACVYLGHHYVIDVIAGLGYGLGAYGVLRLGERLLTARRERDAHDG